MFQKELKDIADSKVAERENAKNILLGEEWGRIKAQCIEAARDGKYELKTGSMKPGLAVDLHTFARKLHPDLKLKVERFLPQAQANEDREVLVITWSEPHAMTGTPRGGIV